MTNDRSRRGTLLVVILGLITIFLALVLAITVRVYNSTKSGTVVQQTVQAYLMMIAAKKVIAGSGPDVVGGDDPGLFTACGRPFADGLGWFKIKGAGTKVLACGGSSAKDGAKTSVDSGNALRNAYEIRLYYTIGGTPPNLTASLEPVADNSTYW